MKTHTLLLLAAGALSLGATPALAQFSIPWSTIDGGGASVTGGPFAISGTISQTDASGALSGGNFTVTGGFWPAAVSAVLAVPGDGDGGKVVEFSLGVHPNPTMGRGLNVAWSLPKAESARLDLVDVNGRRVMRLDVGSMGVGRHTMNLAAERRIAPGVYWVRLTQGANQRSTRVAVME